MRMIAVMMLAACMAGAQNVPPSAFAPLGRIGMGAWLPLKLNPVAWYQAEDNALDSAGANDGTWGGTAAYASGTVGRGFSLNGSSRVQSGLVIAEGPATISAWIKSNTHTDFQAIAGAGYLAAANGAGLFVSSANWNFQNRTGLSVATVFAPHLSNKGWNHLAGVRTGETIALYVNGFLAASTPSTQASQSNVSFGIGSRRNDIGEWGFGFNGQIDDVLIFDRALSAAEIKKLYNESVKRNGRAWE